MKTAHQTKHPKSSVPDHYDQTLPSTSNAALRQQLLLIEEVEPRAEIKVWSFFGLRLPVFF